ncbi:MAG: hypothetical protein J1F35_08840 [Erysipelotrichales bacterium]|nr:hypothetical protein [Erysipelotrichales bacterium]
MGKLFDDINKYFNESSSEQLKNDWEELKKYNDEGPDIEDIILSSENFILFSKCINEIDKISKLEENWDCYDAVVPSEIVIENAKKFVSLIFNNGYKVFDKENIYPTPYGSIIIDIEPKDDYYVSIEIGKAAIGWFTKFGKNNYPEELMSDIYETNFKSLPEELKIALDKLYSII